jgi:hypothetical protein
LLKIIAELPSLAICLFRTTVRISNYESPCTHEAREISLIEINSCNALLRILPLCITTYLKSVLRLKFLTLYTHLLYTVYLRELGHEDPWSFFEAKRGPRKKKLETFCKAFQGEITIGYRTLHCAAHTHTRARAHERVCVCVCVCVYLTF